MLRKRCTPFFINTKENTFHDKLVLQFATQRLCYWLNSCCLLTNETFVFGNVMRGPPIRRCLFRRRIKLLNEARFRTKHRRVRTFFFTKVSRNRGVTVPAIRLGWHHWGPSQQFCKTFVKKVQNLLRSVRTLFRLVRGRKRHRRMEAASCHDLKKLPIYLNTLTAAAGSLGRTRVLYFLFQVQ